MDDTEARIRDLEQEAEGCRAQARRQIREELKNLKA